MKHITKSIIASTLLAGAVFAGSTDVVNGWNLKGASSDINATDINCAKAIWTYNAGAWGLYVRSDISNSTNYGYPSVSQLNQGQGFWVLGENCTNTSTGSSDTNTSIGSSQYFNAFGRSWESSIKDERYIDNNVSFYEATDVVGEYFTITANKKVNNDSRAEVNTKLDKDIQAVTKIKLTQAGVATFARFRLYSFGVSYSGYTNPYAYLNVDTFGNKIRARLYIQESGSSTQYEQIGSDILVNISGLNGGNTLGEKIKLVVKIVGTELKVTAKDSSDTIIGETIVVPTTGIANLTGFDKMTLMAEVYDEDPSYTAGEVASFDVYNADAWPMFVSTVATPNTVDSLFADGAVSYLFSTTDNDTWYDKITGTSTGITMDSYDYNGTDWNSAGTDSATRTSNHIVFPSGAEYDVTVNKTLSIDSFSDAYLNYITFKVTKEAIDYDDVNYWNWMPTYDNGTNQNAPVTTNAELLTMFLFGNNWIGGYENPAMFDGSGSAGNMVRAVQDGVWDGCTVTSDNDCKKMVKTSEVIGTWSLESDGKIVADIGKELTRLSIEEVATSVYKVKDEYKDKVGAVFNDKILSGSGVNETIVRGLLE